jgi:hypothetical protein
LQVTRLMPLFFSSPISDLDLEPKVESDGIATSLVLHGPGYDGTPLTDHQWMF